jgi:hypothetical protein
MLAPGNVLDAQDTQGCWYLARVRAVSSCGAHVFITFLHWSPVWDEWMARGSARLAERGVHTRRPGAACSRAAVHGCGDTVGRSTRARLAAMSQGAAMLRAVDRGWAAWRGWVAAARAVCCERLPATVAAVVLSYVE